MTAVLDNPVILGIGILSVLNLALILVVSWRQLKHLKEREELFEGTERKTMEEVLSRHKKQLANHNKNLKELGEILSELVENNKLNVQKVGMVRFNPFEDTGSNMSFALVLLNDYDTGVVISSLHSREGTRIYAKAVQAGKSKHNLTDEEQEAIDQAQQSSSKK